VADEIVVQIEEEVVEPFDLSANSQQLIQRSIRLSREKVSEYIQLLEVSIVPWAAMILNPRYKLYWINKHLPQRRNRIEYDFKEHFATYYPPLASDTPAPRVVTPEREVNPSSIGYNAISAGESDDEDDGNEEFDEATTYINQRRDLHVKEEALLEWWQGRKGQFPRLFRMAMDLLTIPPMSSENERDFSEGKLVLDTQRLRLRHEKVNQILCLKKWRRLGSVE
jgi:hypothetical protein